MLFHYIKLVLYCLIQCTWGIIQTSLGVCLFLRYLKQPHLFYHGAIRTKWSRLDGVSLGLFIFTPDDTDSAHLAPFTDSCNRMAVHEYGHTYQSLLLGPLYLPVVGIISFIWARHPRYKRLRQRYHVPYSFCWVESWANQLGEKILKQPALKR
ncbi:hypothetical protein [Marinilactibacillus kalidii]|uniref:hypothetical protein n=1 Tax=Marinilactibacillus kalidii TaxID=2820274 RepID=UPI001ABED9F2|nr:hypothetical protein [Marinilactibacillus kalidii]